MFADRLGAEEENQKRNFQDEKRTLLILWWSENIEFLRRSCEQKAPIIPWNRKHIKFHTERAKMLIFLKIQFSCNWTFIPLNLMFWTFEFPCLARSIKILEQCWPIHSLFKSLEISTSFKIVIFIQNADCLFVLRMHDRPAKNAEEKKEAAASSTDTLTFFPSIETK